MQRIIYLLLVLQTFLFGCLSCNSGAIYVTTKLDVSIQNDRITNIRVHWDLDPVFSQIVLGDFDLNRNKRFDPEEITDVRSNLLPMREYNFFIDFTLGGKPLQLNTLENFHVQFANGLVSYHFDIPVDQPFKEIVPFEGGFKDLEARDGSIFYRFDDKAITLIPENAATCSIESQEHTDRDGWVTQHIHAEITPKTLITVEPVAPVVEKTAPTPPNLLTQTLKTMTDNVHGYLVTMQEAPSISAVAMVLLLSLLYGMLHAAGPGHGKMLVASYFVAHDRSYARAVTLGLMIATVHVFSALILTMVIYYLIDTVFSKTLEEASRYITMGSGLLIILIALYLFWQKWRAYNKSAPRLSFQKASTQMPLAPPNAPQPHVHNCGCHSCKTTSHTTDLGVVILAGIVPCPGTVIIFMFALSMGLYTIGIASATVMSLGMGLTIALTAIISTKAKRSSRYLGQTAVKVIEFSSVGVMALLGTFLLFA